MDSPATERPEQSLTGRKLRDRAAVFWIVGLALLMPPLADAFQLDWRVGGLPFTAVYLFSVWALLIIGAALLARRLGRTSDAAGDEPGL